MPSGAVASRLEKAGKKKTTFLEPIREPRECGTPKDRL
jgi:hypothetical protein